MTRTVGKPLLNYNKVIDQNGQTNGVQFYTVSNTGKIVEIKDSFIVGDQLQILQKLYVAKQTSEIAFSVIVLDLQNVVIKVQDKQRNANFLTNLLGWGN